MGSSVTWLNVPPKVPAVSSTSRPTGAVAIRVRFRPNAAERRSWMSGSPVLSVRPLGKVIFTSGEGAPGGRGRKVEVAMLDVCMPAINGALGLVQDGFKVRRLGNRHPTTCPCNTYPCADGEIWIY